jgi:hypothetical protein
MLRHFTYKTRLMIAAGAVLSGAMLAASGLPAQAATTVTVTQSNCGINILNLVQECTSLTSNGTHLYSLSGWGQNLPESIDQPFPDVHIELYGPKGLIKNCASVAQLTSGEWTATCTWSPNDTRAAGNYCSRMWSYIGTKWYDLANECEPLPFPTPHPSP